MDGRRTALISLRGLHKGARRSARLQVEDSVGVQDHLADHVGTTHWCACRLRRGGPKRRIGTRQISIHTNSAKSSSASTAGSALLSVYKSEPALAMVCDRTAVRFRLEARSPGISTLNGMGASSRGLRQPVRRTIVRRGTTPAANVTATCESSLNDQPSVSTVTHSDSWQRFASAVGGFAVGVAVNLISPKLTAQGITLIAICVALTFMVAYLRAKHADTLLSVIALGVLVAGAVVAAVVALSLSDEGRGFVWAIAALLGVSAALVPQAPATATALKIWAQHQFEASDVLRTALTILIVIVAAALIGGGIISLVEGEFGFFALTATAGLVLGLVAVMWRQGKVPLGLSLAVVTAVALALIAVATAISGDLFSAAWFTALSLSFGGVGAAGVLKRPSLRGWLFVGAAILPSAGFVAGAFYGVEEYLGYSEATWKMRPVVAAFFLTGAIGVLLERSWLAVATIPAGVAAIALGIISLWRYEYGEWSFFLVYGVIGMTSGGAVIAASPALVTARRWSKLLTTRRPTVLTLTRRMGASPNSADG